MQSIDNARLRQWLSKYHNPDATMRDILNLVSHYNNLMPAQDDYTFNDGTPMQLVHLKGTIPVPYKGNVYNIPICVWLMNTHPTNAPICYVKPTCAMSIKPSMFVDQNGKIYLPYLHDWDSNSSDLSGLIQVMVVTFGEQPPVFSRPAPAMPQPSMPVAGYMPFVPYPPQPYPPTSSYGGYPPQHMSTVPGMPPYPTTINPAPTPYPPYPPNSMISNEINSGTIKEEHIRESLLTAIEEKLMRLMREQYQQNQAELETLKRTLDELKQGQARLNNVFNRLEKEQNDLDKNITVLKDKEQELDKAIEKLENQESIDVDDAVTTTAPLYKQLLNAFAEEAALEDAIYYMGEALRCEVIDLDVFLRQVRTLSRKQFMLRALMQKCRQKAGLNV